MVVPDPVVRLVSAVVPPLAALKVVLPLPVRVRFCAPLIAPVKVTTPEPAATVRSPFSVVVPLAVTLLLVVVSVAAGVVSAPV